MDKLQNLNIAKKISSGLNKVGKNPWLVVITILVSVLILLVILGIIYTYLLNREDYDLVYHKHSVMLNTSDDINIPASELPGLTSAEYTLHTWFAVDKSQYNTNDVSTDDYVHLISYEGANNNLALGTWIDASTNNLLIIYKTLSDPADTNYDPNSSDFNCPNKISLRNYLMNEWNLLSLVVKDNNIMVYLNGRLYKTQVSEGTLYFTQNNPPLDIILAKKRNVHGRIQSIRFKDYAAEISEISDLYFSSPHKLNLPDIRGVDYIGSFSHHNILASGSNRPTFLDSGANLIDDALNGMSYIFK